jgi:hypothetical protein
MEPEVVSEEEDDEVSRALKRTTSRKGMGRKDEEDL